MKGSKSLAALKARIKVWNESPTGSSGRHIGPSENRNQETHCPGSQNRKKGYGSRSSRR